MNKENTENVNRSNEPEKACDIYANVYKKYPTAFKDFANYGMALYDTKQFQAASEMLEKAIEDNPDDEALLENLLSHTKTWMKMTRLSKHSKKFLN